MKDKSFQSPVLADLIHVGQLVRAIIIGLDQQPRAGASNSKSGKKTISLSLQVSKVNSGLTTEALQRNVPLPACVISVEDHGYTLSFGIKGVTGFLSKKNQGSGKKDDAAGLKPGMLIECVAQSQKAKQKTVKATAAPTVITDTMTEDYPGLSIGKTRLTHHRLCCQGHSDMIFIICSLHQDSPQLELTKLACSKPCRLVNYCAATEVTCHLQGAHFLSFITTCLSIAFITAHCTCSIGRCLPFRMIALPQ